MQGDCRRLWKIDPLKFTLMLAVASVIYKISAYISHIYLMAEKQITHSNGISFSVVG
jgi:hypothetical protein